MTSEQADILAERIQAQPHLYNSPPNMREGMPYRWYAGNPYTTYPWLNLTTLKYDWAGNGENLYYSPMGFTSGVYSGIVKEWETTPVDPIVFSAVPRYITLDDIRMMAYVGLEYVKAKLEDGWRYTYGALGENGSAYPSGYIARMPESGYRYVHRNGEVYYGPTEGGIIGRQTWSPLMRQPGMGTTSVGGFVLPEDYEIPEEPTSDLLWLGSIEGNNDIIEFAPFLVTNSLDWNVGQNNNIVLDGGMEIIVTPNVTIDDAEIESSLVAFQQRVQPVYQIYRRWEDYVQSNENYWMDFDLHGHRYYYTYYTIDYSKSPIPLQRGVTYNVFAKFDAAVLKNFKDAKLVQYSRIGTRQYAPISKPSARKAQVGPDQA